MSLRECPGCQRHVKSAETACPFCATSLTATVPATTGPLPRLGRAALLAIGASAATAACEATPPATSGGPSTEVRDAAPPPAPEPTNVVAPAYGAPPPTATEPTPPPQPPNPPRTIYGGPPVKK